MTLGPETRGGSTVAEDKEVKKEERSMLHRGSLILRGMDGICGEPTAHVKPVLNLTRLSAKQPVARPSSA